MHRGRALYSAAEHSPHTEQAGKSPGPKMFVVREEARRQTQGEGQKKQDYPIRLAPNWHLLQEAPQKLNLCLMPLRGGKLLHSSSCNHTEPAPGPRVAWKQRADTCQLCTHV